MAKLIVPMHIDALYLDQEKLVADATANFENLPYNTGAHDINYEIPYISEVFLSKPLQNKNLWLPKGVHLHWAMPNALVSGEAGASGSIDFPKVPDRWLVLRSCNGSIGNKGWIVESDYLHPPESSFPGIGDEAILNPYHAISYPVSTGPVQPYRYMGRYYELDKATGRGKPEKTAMHPDARRLKNFQVNGLTARLTAVGYGDLSFSAFYPNCRSVFGFYDADVTDINNGNLSYEVYGWYNDSPDDPLASLIASKSSLSPADLKVAISNTFNWNVVNDIAGCNGLVCYGIIAKANFVSKKGDNALSAKVAVGNTGTEALSALLGNEQSLINLYPVESKLTNEEKIAGIEEQLESVLLAAKVAGVKLDNGEKLLQAMHEKGFSPVDGGIIWNLNINNTQSGSNSANIYDAAFQLPLQYATTINDLNSAQEKCNRAMDEFASLKQQLYADWYKYMVANYHSDLQEAQDTDRIREIIGKVDTSGNLSGDLKVIDDKKKEITGLQQDCDAKVAPVTALIDNFNAGGKIPGIQFTFSNIDDTKVPKVPGSYRLLLINTNLVYDALPTDSCTVAPDPLIGNLSVAQFKGSPGNKLDQPGVRGFLSSIAMWVFIDKDQPLPDKNQPSQNGTLLQCDNNARSIISVNAFGDLWSKLYVNGVLLDPGRPLKFDDIPQSQWVHIYLVAASPIPCTNITLFASLKGRLASVRLPLTVIVSEDDRFCDRNIIKLKTLTKKKDKGPRYWQPNNPVVIISGADMKPGLRNEPVRELKCFTSPTLKLTGDDVNYLALPDTANFPDLPGLPVNSNNDWNPAFLQWEAILDDDVIKENVYSQNMSPDFITSSYDLVAGKYDLQGTPAITKNDTIKMYSGSTILSAHAKTRLSGAIDDYINSTKDNSDNVNPGIMPSVLSGAQTILNNSNFLSQSLDGFNAALLQLHKTLQFSVTDPVAFDGDRITKKVNEFVAGETKYAAVPVFEFNPIRTGAISINKLSVIDNFGQVLAIPLNVKFSRTFITPVTGGPVFMPPRIMQPARINFRWLSGADGDSTMEMNDHPATSPVCGWLLPNNLDNSLMVYDEGGKMLGKLKASSDKVVSQFVSEPGGAPLSVKDTVLNSHLQIVINNLSGKTNFLKFIELLDDTLYQTDPENFAQHMDLAILMGRPIAVVRATVNLEVQGRPAINQGWEFFDLDGQPTTTNKWENVKFPVLIGEPGILNDGVLGFWKDSDPVFKSVHLGVNDSSPWYVTHEGGANTIPLSVSVTDPGFTITMLLDPRGEAHATSGILPAKSINIPAYQFKDALRKMSISIFTRPILTPVDNDNLSISLPDEDGYSWSWLTKNKEAWKEIFPADMVDRESFVNGFTAVNGNTVANANTIWKEMVDKKMITETGIGSATLNPPGVWSSNISDSSNLFTTNLNTIQNLLYNGKIIPMETKENFAGSMEVREGWLKLEVQN